MKNQIQEAAAEFIDRLIASLIIIKVIDMFIDAMKTKEAAKTWFDWIYENHLWIFWLIAFVGVYLVYIFRREISDWSDRRN